MLPFMEWTGFLLGEATATERLSRDRLTCEAWGAGLSRAQYLARERFLRQTTHGATARHTWVLRLQNGAVVASCETYRLPLSPSGGVEVIASVFVDRPLRGAGMASKLIEALVAHRREAGLDGLVLFSEVGAGLYERMGFKVLPAPTRRWFGAPAGHTSVELLGRDSLQTLLEQRARLRTGIELKVFEPLVHWHLARADFYAEALERPVLDSLGATDGHVTALWCPDHKNRKLRVLEVSGPEGMTLEFVMRSASAEAQRLDLDSVELWDDAHSSRLVGGTAFERPDDLPMGLSFTPRGELFLGPLSRLCWA